MKVLAQSSVALLGLVLFLHPPIVAADWLQWRGPGREDHSPDTGLLKEWPKDGPKRVWLFQDAGLGYGGYSVAGDRLFTVGLRGDTEFLIAVDAKSGQQLWSTPIGPKYTNGWGDGPRMTPTVDGDRVYALGGNGLLVCAAIADGKIRWQKSLVKDLGGQLQDWGYTESPLVAGDRIFCTPGGSKGTMAALNKLTGEVLWRSEELKDNAQYSSPILVERSGQPQVVQLVMEKFFGLDPATGKLIWKSDFPGKVAVIPTPIQHDGIVYVTAGYGVGCKAVRLGAGKTVETVYENKVMKNHHGGVVRVGDHLYGYSDGPGWVCQDFKTGKEIWANKSLGKGAIHFADGMLYCLDEGSGEVALVVASPSGWSEKGRFKLSPQSERRNPQGRIWPHPVVVNGRLYLRDQELLFSYDVKGN
ncbi:MAG TPA: PQQ-like beta-propeller repeat protein [Verrucomicrobiota bacterium]|nr:polyvinylalcohol dehydrogenase [Verrucomicrobiales bacterium]HRI11682.1 PQQ-like beta-propeller repeat protein [Verrucomicrobiota bacterium]